MNNTKKSFDYDSQSDSNDEECYTLTEWGCLYCILTDYRIDVSGISGKVGQHIVEDFMDLMCKCGYIDRNEDDK